MKILKQTFGTSSPARLPASEMFAGECMPSMAANVFKACACGRTYTRGQWGLLRDRGIQYIDDDGPALAMRDCACGSTLAIEVPDFRQPIRQAVILVRGR